MVSKRIKKRMHNLTQIFQLHCHVTSFFPSPDRVELCQHSVCGRCIVSTPRPPTEREISEFYLPSTYFMKANLFFNSMTQWGSSGQLTCNVLFLKTTLFCTFSNVTINSFFFSRIACCPVISSTVAVEFLNSISIPEIRSLAKCLLCTSYP